MMTSYVIAGIIGVLIWQVIIIIVYSIIELLKGDSDELALNELALKFAIFVPYFIFNVLKGIDYILGYFLLLWFRKHFCKYDLCYKVYFHGTLVERNVTFFATKKMVENLSFDDTKDHYVKFIDNCTKLKRIPHGYKIYKGQDTYQDLDMNLFRKEIKVKEKENIR